MLTTFGCDVLEDGVVLLAVVAGVADAAHPAPRAAADDFKGARVPAGLGRDLLVLGVAATGYGIYDVRVSPDVPPPRAQRRTPGGHRRRRGCTRSCPDMAHSVCPGTARGRGVRRSSSSLDWDDVVGVGFAEPPQHSVLRVSRRRTWTCGGRRCGRGRATRRRWRRRRRRAPSRSRRSARPHRGPRGSVRS